MKHQAMRKQTGKAAATDRMPAVQRQTAQHPMLNLQQTVGNQAVQRMAEPRVAVQRAALPEAEDELQMKVDDRALQRMEEAGDESEELQMKALPGRARSTH
ncbi:hypothetical protein IDH44_18700 [Paenibacillus sp. IB182496]|uniref:Uncharacterized protein n=1 Tax=Paenibacillus sabuli TaxID=2772509 RepID=A0A927GT49_9BACL|nr:hypothetical protein [Paenibacillus sabuli]MBD2847233.1 hypothetical protein [Paenibacillus sabuli]